MTMLHERSSQAQCLGCRGLDVPFTMPPSERELLEVGCQDLPASPAEHDPHLVPRSHPLDVVTSHLHFTDKHISHYT